MQNFVLTSSSATEGHPDKLCDCISDAIVDAYLARDPGARLTAEAATASGIVFLAAHVAADARVDLPEIVKSTVAHAGYTDPDFNPDSVSVVSSVVPAHQGVDDFDGDAATVNTTVFGFACRQTEEMLPLAAVLAHRLARRMSDQRKGQLPDLHPDGQAQVAIRYRHRIPVAIEGITLAVTRGKNDRRTSDLADALRPHVIAPVRDGVEIGLSRDALVHIGSPGSGGPTRHAGLTGRKNDMDTYGTYCRNGGAALSGKDPSRLDRTGAYLARYAAKNVVAAGLAEECEVQLSYTMGRSRPVSLDIDTFGSGKVPDEDIVRALDDAIDFSNSAVRVRFALAGRPRERDGSFFGHLGAYGHFGRAELALPWEETDVALELARNV